MEKNQSHKSASFTRINGYKKGNCNSPKSPNTPNPQLEQSQDSGGNHNDITNLDISQHFQDIDQFIDAFSTPPESVETLCQFVESRISKYNSGSKFGQINEDDETFIEAVKRISKLTNAYTESPSDATATCLNRTSLVLQRAMAFMEDELRALLEDSRNRSLMSKATTTKSTSFDSYHCVIDKAEDGHSLNYSEEMVNKMKMLAQAMVLAGYETECCQVYAIERRIVFKDQLKRHEFEKFNIEDVQKMHREALEGEIARWIEIVKHCSNVLFPSELKLVLSVFSDYPMISRSLFTNLARTIVIQLLDFAEAVAMTKRSAEKLFKFLDMYETLRELAPAISSNSDDGGGATTVVDSQHELKSEIEVASDRMGEAAVNIFTDLENSIKNDAAKTPVPGGAVHPLTRYVMNYLKYACEYKDTLEQVFEKHAKFELDSESTTNEANTSPYSKQLVRVMDLLDSNLEAKSRLYKDISLCYIFLMNNGRYILQKVKGSAEIHQVMGDTWCRKRSTVVRQYHKNYQRETWGRLLQCIGLDGLQQVNGKVSKTVLKEKFKNFNTMFEEIHKTQSTWVVSDEQLLSELRVSISAVVIPAYRSFLGRYRHYLEGGRQATAEKYIKYQPEDLEGLIEGLFEGNAMSMGRRR